MKHLHSKVYDKWLCLAFPVPEIIKPLQDEVSKNTGWCNWCLHQKERIDKERAWEQVRNSHPILKALL